MTEPASNGKPRKPQARSTKFALYAVILLALLTWMGHDNAITAEAAETDLKRQQQKIDTENRRVEAAYALMNKAVSNHDSAEQIRLYDEIINTYEHYEEASLSSLVSWATYKKALTVTDPLEKSRLFRTVAIRYYTVFGKQLNNVAMPTLGEILNLTEVQANKKIFGGDIFEKQGSHVPDLLTAWLMNRNARSTSDPAEKIAIYDAVLSRFLYSDDSAFDSAFDAAVATAMEKTDIITDKNEQIRLCDIVIDAYLKTPQRMQNYYFGEAVKKKAELVGDPSLPLTLYNQVIANNVTEEAVAQARSKRMALLTDETERLAACDEFIAVHQASEKSAVQLMVAQAMIQKTDLLTDPEAKAALFHSIIEKYDNIDDSFAKNLANQTMAKLAALNGDTVSAARYYDEKAANAKNELDAINALHSKAKTIVKDKAEKIRIYDEIITKGENNKDGRVSMAVKDAFLQKIKLIDDKEEKSQLYDGAIARIEESGNTWLYRYEAINLMLEKAKIFDDKETKIHLYDEIIASNISNRDNIILSRLGEAMHEKAKLVDNKKEKIKLYDAILFDMVQTHGYLYSPRFVLRERVELADAASEKVQLYDRYIAASGDVMDSATRMSLLLDKTEFMIEPADKLRQYDEIIEFSEQSLHDEESGDNRLHSFSQTVIMSTLGKAIINKIDLLESAEEKLKLCDRYLALAKMVKTDFTNIYDKQILDLKVKVSGDPSINNDYFDDNIRAAATDRERIKWYRLKFEAIAERMSFRSAAAKNVDIAAVEEEIITKFFDSTEDSAESLVTKVLLNKIKRTIDLNERDVLCDHLITRYQNSTDGIILSAVVRAFIFKAEAAKEDETKFEIYSAVIERYQDMDNYWVKKEVDEAIAAKFRLEMKGK